MQRFYLLLTSARVKQLGIVVWFLLLGVMLLVAIDPRPFVQFGYLGIFMFNLFGPGTVLIPLVVEHFHVLPLAVVSAMGMSFNDSVSWLIGKHGEVLIPKSMKFIHLESLVKRSNPFILFVLAVLPIPYDFVGMSAGYFGVPFWTFCIPGVLGKIVRFVILGFFSVYLHRLF